MTHTISRDVFARTETVKRTMPCRGLTCNWCGQAKPSGKLFEYGTLPDDARWVNWHRGYFCSKGCHDSYHS